LITVSLAADTFAMQSTRDIKVISSAGARAMADACTAWAERNKQIVAIRFWIGAVIIDGRASDIIRSGGLP
jgi:hypothetical protein